MPTKRSKAARSAVPTSSRKRAPESVVTGPSKRAEVSRKRARTHTTPFSLPAPSQKLLVYVCGEGSSGELGLGSGQNVTDVKAPRPNFTYLAGVTSIATGGMHAAALRNNKLLTWGVNDLGTLGRDTTWKEPLRSIDAESSDDNDVGLNPREATPTVVITNFPSETKLVQVATGDSTTLVLTGRGLVYGCGTFRDHNGVYGFTYDQSARNILGTQEEPIRAFIPIPNLKNVIQVSAGADYALALDNAGKVFAWGCGQQCELGRRVLERRRPEALLPTRVEIPTRHKIESVHAAANHAFAIDSNGDTWSWGLNNFGQTGITANAGQGEAIVSSPTKVPSLVGKHMKMIVGGMHHSLGLTKTGQCLAWGRIDGSQSGLDVSKLEQDKILSDSAGRPRILLEPTALPIPKCSYIAAGSDHCLAVTSDGKAYSWGFNATYQCGQGTSDDILVVKLMEGKHIREEQIVWAGGGGQYSMLASTAE